MSDDRPVTIFSSDNFLVGKIDEDDDYRLGTRTDEGEPAKWLAPDGRDLGFSRAELVELRDLLNRAIAGCEPPINVTAICPGCRKGFMTGAPVDPAARCILCVMDDRGQH